jgi:oligopeptide/dipeptide ABC transporter ATP-binding protein
VDELSSASHAGSESLLSIRHLSHEYAAGSMGGAPGGRLRAVSDISFDLLRGETLGVVGESGCGKSTMAKAIMQAPKPTEGEVILEGEDLRGLRGRDLRSARRKMQMVSQDPYSSLDPKWRIAQLVEEPLSAHKIGTAAQRKARVTELFDLVGLDLRRHGERYPRELSGGQCQRVAIARAIALSPQVVICDEAVSALDVSIQAQILNLFESLKAELHLSYLFISHDLSVVRHISDRILVMYMGKVCEAAVSGELYRHPYHPYTAALLSAIPAPVAGSIRTRVEIEGDLPSPISPPSGCRFRTRCRFAQPKCAVEEPELRELVSGHQVACHFPLAREV